MNPWAVFDVDGTLIPNHSMESAFLKQIFDSGFIKTEQILRHVGQAARLAFRNQLDTAIYQNKTYLKGMSQDDVARQARTAFEERIAANISPQGLYWVNHYRREGFRILVMTGAPDFLARHLLPVFDPDHMISTITEIENGFYTGRISGLHPYGMRKTLLLQRTARKLHIDFSRSVVFANHATDQDHMRIFGRAIAVNPSLSLQKTATLRNWEMMRWQ